MEQTDYVSYELAKKLKETGFDWECRGYYPKSGELCSSIEADNFNYLGSTYKGEWFSDTISAPTLWHAQKWLREKKDIHVQIEAVMQKQWTYSLVDTAPWSDMYGEWHDRISEDRQGYPQIATYEQALSAGISAALDLLAGKEGE